MDVDKLRIAVASAPAVVRVRNLQTSVAGPSDAWGRQGRPQPALVSASVYFDTEFGKSTVTDTVAEDTVHYGLLSKAIITSLERPLKEGDRELPSQGKLVDVLGGIWGSLTGKDLDGWDLDEAAYEPFLSLQGVRALQIKVHLPKASLLGDGVSATHVSLFAPGEEQGQEEGYIEMGENYTCLRIHDVRVPTLIGVNDNERQARQTVTANLEIEDIHLNELESYHEITRELVNIMSDSSFETLEALAKRISEGIAPLLRYSIKMSLSCRLRISLEKPIAVVFADAACVELYVNPADIFKPEIPEGGGRKEKKTNKHT